jgi:dTDP-glucose pyrophosphorylase
MSWQTVIAAAGQDNISFQENGIDIPKNLIPFRNDTILGTAIRSYSHKGTLTHVAIRSDESQEWNTDKILSANNNRVKFHKIPKTTRGALCSAAMTLDDLKQGIPLIVAAGDSFIDGDLESVIGNFTQENAAAGTILFQDSLPRWSYARIGQNSKILEMAEKSPISTFASTGLFYFRSPELFIRATEWVLKENMHTHGEFYLSSALNYLIMNGENVLGVQLPSGYSYTPLSTYSDFDIARKGTV